MNIHPQNTSGKTEANTAVRDAGPDLGERHIEPATSNANPASEAAIQSAASHARDMLPPPNLAPQDVATPSSSLSFVSVGAHGKAVNAATPKPDISKIGFKPGLNPNETFNKVLTMAKDERPPVADYLSQQYIHAHRQKFASGKAYCIMSTDASIERVQVNGRLGRSSGNFVLPEKDFKFLLGKIDAEKKSRNGDPQKMLETELGFWPGSLKGKELVCYEINIKPEEIRIPDGRGEGANDLWLPGGFLPTGYTEAIIDPAKLHQASKSVLVNGTTSNFTTRTRMDVLIKERGSWTLYAGKQRDLDVASNSDEHAGVLKVIIGSVCKTAVFLRVASEDFERYSHDTQALKNFVQQVQENPLPYIDASVSVLANVLKGDQLGERKRSVTQRSDGLQARVILTPNTTVFEADSVAVAIPENESGRINDDPTPDPSIHQQ